MNTLKMNRWFRQELEMTTYAEIIFLSIKLY